MENNNKGNGNFFTFDNKHLREILNMKINAVSAGARIPEKENQAYITAFYKFGLLPSLFLLETLEKMELYYECYLLKLTIDEINLELNFNR